MDPFTLWIIGGIVAAIFVTAISWEAIKGWLATPRTNAAYGKLIRKHLADGNYVVVGGVFDSDGEAIASQSWQGDSLDDELKRKFGYRDEIIVTL